VLTVSVVIPTYNRADEVIGAVESALAQTYGEFDVWVIDDGSTDATEEALAPYRDRINYMKTSNLGHAGARNHGIRASRGRYLAFLDSDDRWYPEKLERVASEAAKAPGVGLLYTDVVVVDTTRRPLWVQRTPDASGDAYLGLLKGNFITMSSAVVSRAALERVGLFDETFRLSPDWDLWLRIARQFPIRRVPCAVTEYRAHGADAQSADPSEDWANELRRVIQKAFSKDPQTEAIYGQTVTARLHYAVGRAVLLQGDYGRAASEFRQSWRLRPGSWKAALFLGVAATRGARFLPRRARRMLRLPQA
jgi:glycosyltransferase involved in cell wall biosynthesis